MVSLTRGYSSVSASSSSSSSTTTTTTTNYHFHSSSSSRRTRTRFRLWSSRTSFQSRSAIRSIALFVAFLCLAVVTTTLQHRYGNQLLVEYHDALRRNLRRHYYYPLLSPSSQRPLTDRTVRYLTLGGPSTGGQGLLRTAHAYPYQLSHNNVHNYAVATPATAALSVKPATDTLHLQQQQQQIMASLCTQSIVGDWNVYDVITLEYEAYEPKALAVLTRRLRERFPMAAIVFVKLWSPLDLEYYNNTDNKDNSVEAVSFAEWRTQQYTIQQQQHSSSLSHLIPFMKERSWGFREGQRDGEQDRVLEEIIQSVNGLIYRLPKPTDINQSLDTIADWFLEEDVENFVPSNEGSFRYTLSSLAHSKVAKGLPDIVEQAKALALQSATSTTPTLLGTWGSGDMCQVWYETGEGIPRQHSRGLKYKEFSNHYALEVVAQTGASLQVRNPFQEDRMVYLTYMTTSANASSKKVYPRTKVQLQVVQQQQQQQQQQEQQHQQLTPRDQTFVVLDPSHDDNSDVSHRTRTTAVGLVPAGATVQLEFTPLEEYTLQRFRIVGLSFLAKEKMTQNIPSEFAMSSSHGLVVEDDDEGDSYVSYHSESFFGWWGRDSSSKRKNDLRLSSSSLDDLETSN
mmetsp:Transcript_30195/g.56658  ORF Transcript_30195/g.56658 Transcript_30195/m.56658 type:complete len:626 (-) Transcript_30195:70-1947(-)